MTDIVSILPFMFPEYLTTFNYIAYDKENLEESERLGIQTDDEIYEFNLEVTFNLLDVTMWKETAIKHNDQLLEAIDVTINNDYQIVVLGSFHDFDVKMRKCRKEIKTFLNEFLLNNSK